jgi:hypothetical protein
MRILGLFASLYLIGRAWRDLANNWDDIVCKTRDLKNPVCKTLDLKNPLDLSSWRFWDTFLYTLQPDGPRAQDNYNVGEALKRYVYHSRFRQIWCRVTVYMLFMFFLYLVLGFNFGFPAMHARGDVSYWLFWITTSVYVFFMLVLLFFVIDVTLLFSIFAIGLSRAQTEWPTEVKRKFEEDIGLKEETSDVKDIGPKGKTSNVKDIGPKQETSKACKDFDNYVTTSVIDYWIDIVFIEKRTKCISFLAFLHSLHPLLKCGSGHEADSGYSCGNLCCGL